MSVNFNGRFSESECGCNGCHAVARVAKLELPNTLYYNKKDLETRYREYWLCDECRLALTKLLNRLEEQCLEG